MRKILFLMAVLASPMVFAQNFVSTIEQYLDQNRSQWGYMASDVENLTMSSTSFSKSMNLQNVYVNQTHNGIEIFNSTSSFAVKNGQVVSAKPRFIQDVGSKVNAVAPSINASAAIVHAAQALGLDSPTSLQLLEENGNEFRFSQGGVSLNEIPVKLVYQPLEDGTIRLAWDLSIYLLDASHYYSVRIDAQNGALLDTIDWVTHCDFGVGAHSHKVERSILFAEEAGFAGGSSYRVFPMPYSSPIDGPDQLVSSPENLNASPFGWHDTDGSAGAEYTITRGNNVWAQEDINGNNGTGASPDGGATLTFDFPFDLPQDPANFTDAATVNLFYWNNVIHDVAYEYGFDEESGNFQENNYGGPGAGSDSVNADAQDGSGTNNANFSTPPDGNNPRMQMFIWSGGSALVDLLEINNGPLAGTYQGIAANFGGPMPVPPLTEDLVVVEDDDSGPSTDPNDGCDTITNGPDLNGKIVVIRRGECEFGFKALQVQNEGALAVIIVNNVPGDPIIMAPGAVGGSVTIPLFMVSDVDGEAIITELLGGNTVNGTISGENIPPDIDGDLDNEIVAHEYAHGISNRLTGGPNNTSCLGNDEQMGEGWSDFLGLIMTMQPGDQPEDVRGLAAYASQNPNGIREAPYSTDFAVNAYTYDDTNFNTTQPHGIGFVWATMLWEMTWDLIDVYGFDADIYNGTGGNNIAFQLVMDGMKLQNCNPGFIDGRDAILEADELTNGGANACLIWEAFARRGCGFSASQGSPFSRTDQVEAFDLPPSCDTLANDDFNYDNNFSIYPNPTNGTINIASKLDVGTTEVSIIDMNGRTVMQQTVEIGTHASLDASTLSAGIYLVQIDGGNYVHTAKLIKR